MFELEYEYLDPETIIGTPDFRFVEAFLKETGRTAIGWHYIVDLTWIYSIAKHWPRNYSILDAGGGSGPTQFLLAELGFQVTNIDLSPAPPGHAQMRRYGTRLTQLRSHVASDYVDHLSTQHRNRITNRWFFAQVKRSLPWKMASASFYSARHQRWRQMAHISQPLGTIDLVQGNLCHMLEVGTASYDALVSLSALEHIPIESLPNALGELRRVLKPSADIAITTSGTEAEHSWFHEPCRGYCYSHNDLGTMFHAKPTAMQSAEGILLNYRRSSYLREHLASFYQVSGNNGMPWGQWDPRYIPVGLRRPDR